MVHLLAHDDKPSTTLCPPFARLCRRWALWSLRLLPPLCPLMWAAESPGVVSPGAPASVFSCPRWGQITERRNPMPTAPPSPGCVNTPATSHELTHRRGGAEPVPALPCRPRHSNHRRHRRADRPAALQPTRTRGQHPRRTRPPRRTYRQPRRSRPPMRGHRHEWSSRTRQGLPRSARHAPAARCAGTSWLLRHRNRPLRQERQGTARASAAVGECRSANRRISPTTRCRHGRRINRPQASGPPPTRGGGRPRRAQRPRCTGDRHRAQHGAQTLRRVDAAYGAVPERHTGAAPLRRPPGAPS